MKLAVTLFVGLLCSCQSSPRRSFPPLAAVLSPDPALPVSPDLAAAVSPDADATIDKLRANVEQLKEQFPGDWDQTFPEVHAIIRRTSGVPVVNALQPGDPPFTTFEGSFVRWDPPRVTEERHLPAFTSVPGTTEFSGEVIRPATGRAWLALGLTRKDQLITPPNEILRMVPLVWVSLTPDSDSDTQATTDPWPGVPMQRESIVYMNATWHKDSSTARFLLALANNVFKGSIVYLQAAVEVAPGKFSFSGLWELKV